MIFKLMGATALVCLAGVVAGQDHHSHHTDYYAHPKYKYEYSVYDPHTHDFKKQEETREGDVVKGYYLLKEPDSTVREVHYTADKEGFKAVVQRVGHAVHPVVEGLKETYFHHSSSGGSSGGTSGGATSYSGHR